MRLRGKEMKFRNDYEAADVRQDTQESFQLHQNPDWSGLALKEPRV